MATDSVAHNQAAIMRYIGKQAEPLIGGYLDRKDYTEKVFDNLTSLDNLIPKYSSNLENLVLGSGTKYSSLRSSTDYSPKKSSTYGQINSYE